MSIEPWVLSLAILIIICALGSHIIKIQEPFSCPRTAVTGSTSYASGSQSIETVPGGTGPCDRRGEGGFFPPLAMPINNEDTPFLMQPYGPFNVNRHGKIVKKELELFEDMKIPTGLPGIVPTQKNLDMISGGSSISEPEIYKPNQEHMDPHEYPRPIPPTMTAQAPTDIGTGAEEIQRGQIATQSVRQNIREEQREEFNNPYAVKYTAF